MLKELRKIIDDLKVKEEKENLSNLRDYISQSKHTQGILIYKPKTVEGRPTIVAGTMKKNSDKDDKIVLE